MSSHYTDVDRLILERWNEVLDLQDAFKGLTDRMRDTVEDVMVKAERWLDEQGYRCEYDVRRPEISAWKPTWEARRGQPGVRLVVGEFAPLGYGKVRSEHPFLWVMTSTLELMKMKEAERIQFARQLRQTLGPSAAKWDDREVSDADSPLGRYVNELAEQDRVAMAAQPQKMLEFVQSGFTQLFDTVAAIDQTLTTMRPAK